MVFSKPQCSHTSCPRRYDSEKTATHDTVIGGNSRIVRVWEGGEKEKNLFAER